MDGFVFKRKIDVCGRVVIPADFAHVLDMNKGEEVNITLEGRKICITKGATCCSFCSSLEELEKFKGQLICKKCIENLLEGN